MEYLQIIVKGSQPGRHFFFLGTGQKTDFLGDRRRGARHNQLVVLALLEYRVQSVGQRQQGFAGARRTGQHRHVDIFTVEQPHRHGLLQIARRKPPEALVHQVIAAVDRQIDVLIIHLIHIGNEILLIVDKLIRVGVGQFGARNAM